MNMKNGYIFGILVLVFVGGLFLTSVFIRYRNHSIKLNYDIKSNQKEGKDDINVKELRRHTTSTVSQNKHMTENRSSVSSPSTHSSVPYTPDISTATHSSSQHEQIVTTVDRVRDLREQCIIAKVKAPKLQKPLTTNHKIYLFRNKIFFCKVPKTGTQFFRKITKGHYRKAITFEQYSESREKYDTFTKILFVREPFSRLVSAYISKLFTVYQGWFGMGQRAISKFRKGGQSGHGLSCGHDVTFQEYTKFVINALEKKGKVDRHFMPNSAQCHPCEIKYDFIGKLETADADVEKFIHLTNIATTLTPKQFYKNYIEDNINGTLSRAYKGNKCTSVAQALERAWVAYQMKGMISHKVDFPYDDITINKSDSLYKMIAQIRVDTPVTTEGKHLVKKIVLRKAFSTVDKADIEKFRKLYFYDFFLYGYDMYPDFLTEKIPLTLDGWEPFKLKL